MEAVENIKEEKDVREGLIIGVDAWVVLCEMYGSGALITNGPSGICEVIDGAACSVGDVERHVFEELLDKNLIGLYSHSAAHGHDMYYPTEAGNAWLRTRYLRLIPWSEDSG